MGTTSSVCSLGFEALDFAADNGFGEFCFLAAVGNVAGDGLLQVVDVVGEDAVELAHFRGNIARHGDVDEEHGPVLAAGEKLFAVFAAEDGMRRAGRSNNDVGAIARVIQVIELDRLAVELLRQTDSAFIGAVGDEDGSATVCH